MNKRPYVPINEFMSTKDRNTKLAAVRTSVWGLHLCNPLPEPRHFQVCSCIENLLCFFFLSCRTGWTMLNRVCDVELLWNHLLCRKSAVLLCWHRQDCQLLDPKMNSAQVDLIFCDTRVKKKGEAPMVVWVALQLYHSCCIRINFQYVWIPMGFLQMGDPKSSNIGQRKFRGRNFRVTDF